MVLILISALLALAHHSYPLQGFDCGHQYKSYKTYDGEKVQACPDIDDWYPEVTPVLSQVIRSSDKNTIVVHECQVRLTRIAQFCGQFESFGYGVPQQTQTDEYKLMPVEDCRKLVDTGVMTYRFNEDDSISFPTFGKGHFSRDIIIRGNRTDNGKCRGEEFSEDDFHFTHHTLRDVIEGKVIKHKVPYNRKTNKVQLNGAQFPVSQRYAYQRSTVVWDNPTEGCEDNVFQLFDGLGQHYQPTADSDERGVEVPSMLLVQNSQHTFGLEIGEVTRICHSDVFMTNLQDVFVVYNTTELNHGLYWKMLNVQKEGGKVDELQNLKSLMTRNYVKETKQFGNAVKQISNDICETKRDVNENTLALMRLNEDEGVMSAFGFGFKAVRRGSAFHIYKCRETEVTYRHIRNTTRDMPISFINSEGIRQNGFLNTVTRHIENSTIYYPENSSLSTMWDFQDNVYKCKTPTGLIDCQTPSLLSTNFDRIKEALQQKNDTIVFSGKIDDITEEKNNSQNQKQFADDVALEERIASKTYKIGQEIISKCVRNIFNTIGMPNFQSEVSNAMDNTNAIGLIPYIVGGIFFFFFFIHALIKLGYLYHNSEHKFWNFRNMWFAVFQPSRLTSTDEQKLGNENDCSLQQIKVDMVRHGYNFEAEK